MLDGDLDQAEKYYLQAIKCNSHNPTSMYHMGQVEARRGDYTKALTWLNHSLHINPNSSPAWNLQGELYLKQGNQPAAINSFKKAIYVKPENSRPYINLAGVYERRADHEFAMEELKTAIILNPNYKEGIYRVANMSLETKNTNKHLNTIQDYWVMQLITTMQSLVWQTPIMKCQKILLTVKISQQTKMCILLMTM